jgi:kumamolisin
MDRDKRRGLSKGMGKTWWRGITALLGVVALATNGLGMAPPRLTEAQSAQQARAAGYKPAQLVSAYNVSPLFTRGITGTGQTIAFIEIDGISTQDLSVFNQSFGLPPARLSVYIPTRATQALAPGTEATLDVEYAHALAPGARLRVYEVVNTGQLRTYSGYLASAVQGAISGGATIISISLRGTGRFCSTALAASYLHSVFQAATAKGISVFAASGDYGAQPCPKSNTVGVVYPASDPYVTGVGGTRLSLTSTGAYAGETAWVKSGGGYSSYFSRPSWQHGSGSGSGVGALTSAHRGVPDVAFDAAPQTGVIVYLQGHAGVVGGTSLGAPCWAAMWALAAQYHLSRTGHALGWANPLLYGIANSSQRTRVFHDVTVGTNGAYQAGAGWDAVTGWGSPNADALVTALTP